MAFRMLATGLAVWLAGMCFAQGDALTAKPQAMKWWREARFGMFIHWGPVSLKGEEISWSRGGERRGTGGTGDIPVDVYDNLYKQFNPTKFNAKEWVAIAKATGMKYMVFTTRHHDGFSEWDTKQSDYNIMHTPFHRDVVAELAKACHEAKMPLGFYYSPPDWHSADYRTANHAKFIKYMHEQIRELLTNYGKVDILWFDGLGGTAEDWDSVNLFKMIRKLQPGIIINNRAGLAGDFGTPEQNIGGFDNQHPWESCITIGDQWAYRLNDNVKSLQQCIQTLVRCVGGDGNLLFNVGPMPTGEIEPLQVQRLKEMGEWLRRCGDSIYGTRGGPYMPGSWGVSTRKGNRVYLHVIDWGGGTISLPALPMRIVKTKVLVGDATVEQSLDAVELTTAPRSRVEMDTVIALDLDGSADTIPILRMKSGSLAVGAKATASNVFENQAEYTADKAIDDDPDTRWATGWGVHSAWMQVDLGERKTVGSATIDEEFGERIQRFDLQYRLGADWVTFAKGEKVGKGFRMKFEPVTARVFRLNILDAAEGPTISEFRLFPP